MSIKEEIFYRLRCDNCGNLADEGNQIVAWRDKQMAVEMAENADWLTGEFDYCPSCTQWDDSESKLIPKKKD